MKQKILVIDDDPVSAKAVVTYLEQGNYIADAAFDGKTAWEMLNKASDDYGLVILDRMMLGIDGMELLHRIKEHATLQHVPVIIITGEAEPAESIDAIASGALEVIYKPVDPKLLLFSVKNAIQFID